MTDTPTTGVMPPPPATMVPPPTNRRGLPPELIQKILAGPLAGEKPKGLLQGILWMAYKKGKIPWLQPPAATPATPAAGTGAPATPAVPPINASLPTDNMTPTPEGIAPGEPNPTAPQTFSDAFAQRAAPQRLPMQQQVAGGPRVMPQAPITGGVGRFRRG